MSYSVTIAAGEKDVVLPNGQRYQAGKTAVLSDSEYSELSGTAIANLFSSITYLGSG